MTMYFRIRETDSSEMPGETAPWNTWLYPGVTSTRNVEIYNAGTQVPTKLWLAVLLADGSISGLNADGDYISDNLVIGARMAGSVGAYTQIGGGVAGTMFEVTSIPAAGATVDVQLQAVVPVAIPYGYVRWQIRTVYIE